MRPDWFDILALITMSGIYAGAFIGAWIIAYGDKKPPK